MQKSSSAESANLIAYRAAAAGFFAAALFVGALFVRALTRGEIRSGLFTYGVLALAVSIGLWLRTHWGRNLGLIMAVGNIGLGAIALLSVILSRDGSPVIPIVLLILSVGAGYAISRPVFNLPEDEQGGGR